MIVAFLLFAVGVFTLIKGADFLVEGASSIGVKMKIKPIVIGLTIVAFGTSAPELLISVVSAVNGSTDLALGNIIGSNISNTLLIIGVSAVIYPIVVKRSTVWKEIPFSFLAAGMVALLALQQVIDEHAFAQLDLMSTMQIGVIARTGGFILLSFFIIFLYYSFGIARIQEKGDDEITEMSVPLSVVYIVGGLMGLALGSQLTVDNAIVIARIFDVSESLIGLTLVAVGTSLPELATSVTAALKKHSDIAVGNVVGSNLFNIFLILGITAVVRPIPITGQNAMDILMLLGVTIFFFGLLFLFTKHKLGKIEGVAMVMLYVAYTAYVVVR